MKITIRKNGALTYRYSATPDIDMEFHMLCEVGEPWQQEAKEALALLERERNVRVDFGVDLNEPPWVVDVARRLR